MRPGTRVMWVGPTQKGPNGDDYGAVNPGDLGVVYAQDTEGTHVRWFNGHACTALAADLVEAPARVECTAYIPATEIPGCADYEWDDLPRGGAFGVLMHPEDLLAECRYNEDPDLSEMKSQLRRALVMGLLIWFST
jgi:hypothetical protein